jgi:hypothetical protein
VGIFSASASGRAEAVKFVAGNSRVVQGNPATVTAPATRGAQVPPAARVFFKIENGMRPIRFYKAASGLVSVVPVYQQTP